MSASAGQAGSIQLCPACGQKVEIPHLRDLRLLPAASDEPVEPGRRWGLPASIATAGVAIALVSWTAAATISVRALPQHASVVSDPAAIARSFEAASLSDVYDIWWSVSRVGVDRGQTEQETAANRIARGRVGVSYALLLFGGLGGILAVAGLTLAAIGRR